MTDEPVELKEAQDEESTIEIQRAGKLRKTKVLKVPIIFEDKPSFVVIKKLSYGERMDFVDKFLKVEVVGEIPKANIDQKVMQIQCILMSLHEAPFPIEEDYIVNELDGSLAEEIYKKCDGFNKLNANQKKTSDGQLNTPQITLK